MAHYIFGCDIENLNREELIRIIVLLQRTNERQLRMMQRHGEMMEMVGEAKTIGLVRASQ